MTDNITPGNIVILSPEPWGKMLVSKMHYALELIKKGNKVFFVNPPRQLNGSGLAVIKEVREGGNLVIVDTNVVPGSLFLRHKLFFLYKGINRRYIRAIKKAIAAKVDQVWSFNPNVYIDLRHFGAEKSILLLYDFYQGDHIFKAAGSADALISVSQVILEHYKETPPPKLLVQHGLGQSFAGKALEKLKKAEFEIQKGDKIKIGYTGNLLRAGMNTIIARQIIERHPEIAFHFWGPYSMQDNNVNAVGGSIAEELASFIDFLQRQRHVVLHGVVEQKALAEGIFEMDAFLFLYSPRTEVNAASNSHKLLEYLSTGKSIISTQVSNYAGMDLLIMSNLHEEDSLPELFSKVIKDLPRYNSKERQLARMNFALDNIYSRQVERIQQFITR
jgi:glycosyltransferase involved in cell wall biosynthesis